MIDICSNPRRPILNCSYTMLYIKWRHSRCQRLSGRQYHPGSGPQLYSVIRPEVLHLATRSSSACSLVVNRGH
jgi:hypothetical protein